MTLNGFATHCFRNCAFLIYKIKQSTSGMFLAGDKLRVLIAKKKSSSQTSQCLSCLSRLVKSCNLLVTSLCHSMLELFHIFIHPMSPADSYSLSLVLYVIFRSLLWLFEWDVPHSFGHLNIWSPVGSAVWGSMAFLEEMCLRGEACEIKTPLP